MQLASYIISLCLHIAVFLIIWFWPAPAPIKIDAPPIMISLVEGDQGGNRAPSPILGHMGDETGEEMAPQTPAPKSEVAVREKTGEAIPKPAQASTPEEPAPVKPAPMPEPVPEKAPEPVREEPQQIPVPKTEPEKTQPKPEPKKETPKLEPLKKETPKPEPKKEQPKPKPAPKTPKRDPVAEALAKARKATSRASSDKGNAVERALAEARRNSGGNRGGGGGSGEGPGGGGLGDVYLGQIMTAVRPNWGFASSTRVNLVCVVKVNVDMQGKVLNAVIDRSSGNAQYDASAMNAVMRTSQAGDFPPPPNQSYTELDLVFTFDELRAR